MWTTPKVRGPYDLIKHWSYANIYMARFVVEPLLPKGAFQWTWNFHVTLDVEGNSTQYHQHILWYHPLEHKSQLHYEDMGQGREEKSLCFNKIWEDLQLQSLSSQVGTSSDFYFYCIFKFFWWQDGWGCSMRVEIHICEDLNFQI